MSDDACQLCGEPIRPTDERAPPWLNCRAHWACGFAAQLRQSPPRPDGPQPRRIVAP